MIIHRGQVRSIVDGCAQITVATSGCASCGHVSGCGIGKLAGSRRETLIALPSIPGLAAGDAVTLELDEAQVTRAAVRGYLLPAILLVIGAILGEIVGAQVGVGGTAPSADTLAAHGALIGLTAGLLLARLGRPLAPRLRKGGG